MKYEEMKDKERKDKERKDKERKDEEMRRKDEERKKDEEHKERKDKERKDDEMRRKDEERKKDDKARKKDEEKRKDEERRKDKERRKDEERRKDKERKDEKRKDEEERKKDEERKKEEERKDEERKTSKMSDIEGKDLQKMEDLAQEAELSFFLQSSGDELPVFTTRKTRKKATNEKEASKALHIIEEGHVPHHVLSFVEGNVVWASTLDGLLHGELDDVAINVQLRLLAKRSKMKALVIDSFAAISMLSANAGSHRYKRIEQDIASGSYTIALGANNENGNHWSLLVLRIEKKQALYLNPLGETDERLSEVKISLERAMRSEEWRVKTIPHAKQHDSISCGVYVIKFAEEILQLSPRRLQFDDSFEDLKTLRRNYPKDIILASDDLSNRCRSCGTTNQEPDWIQCEICEAWLHIKCSDVNASLESFAEVKFACNWCRKPKRTLTSTPKPKVSKRQPVIPIPRHTVKIKRFTNKIKVCQSCRSAFHKVTQFVAARTSTFNKDGKKLPTLGHYCLNARCVDLKGVTNFDVPDDLIAAEVKQLQAAGFKI